MNAAYDVIVVGLGAMGASTAMHLADRGFSVLGVDTYEPPHTLGAHHGESRIIRKAYYEHPSYVPMLERAYALWGEIERRSNRSLMRRTAGLMLGAPGGELVTGVLASAREHALHHELLTPAALHARYPAFRIDADMLAVWEPDAGILHPEECVRTMLALARENGATLHFREAVHSWRATAQGLRVATAHGNYDCGAMILCAGPGLAQLAPQLEASIAVERQVVAHFNARANPDRFAAEHFPIFIFEEPARDGSSGAFFYGIPDLGRGVKVARHHEGAISRFAAVDRNVSERDIDDVRGFLARRIPDANGTLTSSTVCLYTNTPDFHFLIDRLPGNDRVFVASPCSGHGFKFACVVGEIVADMVWGRPPAFDLSMFSAARLLGAGATGTTRTPIG